MSFFSFHSVFYGLICLYCSIYYYYYLIILCLGDFLIFLQNMFLILIFFNFLDSFGVFSFYFEFHALLLLLLPRTQFLKVQFLFIYYKFLFVYFIFLILILIVASLSRHIF